MFIEVQVSGQGRLGAEDTVECVVAVSSLSVAISPYICHSGPDITHTQYTHITTSGIELM